MDLHVKEACFKLECQGPFSSCPQPCSPLNGREEPDTPFPVPRWVAPTLSNRSPLGEAPKQLFLKKKKRQQFRGPHNISSSLPLSDGPFLRSMRVMGVCMCLCVKWFLLSKLQPHIWWHREAEKKILTSYCLVSEEISKSQSLSPPTNKMPGSKLRVETTKLFIDRIYAVHLGWVILL